MIKAILVLGLVAFTAFELRGNSSAGHLALRRFIAAVILCLGLIGVVFPDSVTELANAVGVGRGADLVLYALVIGFLFSTMGLYRQLKKLEDRYVDLARSVAIDQALRERHIGTGVDVHAAAPAPQTQPGPRPEAIR